jgi:serine protease Do
MSEFASFQKGLNVSRTYLSCGVALVLVVSITTIAPAQTRTAGAPSAADLSALLESTSRSVSPSVVQIFATSYTAGDGLVPRSGDLIRTERASGSGVIVDPAGYIITNAHVVRGAGRIRVEVPRPSGGTSILAASADVVGAQVVGMDLETDLAVLKIEREKLPAMAFADSDELKPGQLVLAFGSPLGLTNSVTLGIVGAVARQLEPESPMVWVQTDASINPGSSGGPLVDLRGRLVGINTSIASMTGGNEGVGFSSPSNIVRAVYEQIKATGHVRRGDIGIRVQTITPALARGLGLGRESGVVCQTSRRVVRLQRPESGRATSSCRSKARRWRTAGSSRSACIGSQSAISLASMCCATVRPGKRASRSPSAAIRWRTFRRPSTRVSTW